MSQKRWIAIILGMSIVFSAFLLMLSSAPLPQRPATPTARTLVPATAAVVVTESPTATPTATPVPKPNIGVQGQFIGPDGDAGIKLAADLGVGWIKQQVDWNSIEYARGLYRWEELDHLLAAAQHYGLKIMLSVARAPGFSRPEPVEEDGPPSDFSIFRDFMFALSNRYQGRVAAYELWNETNLKREWRGFELSAD